MSSDPWTAPDPQPGDFDDELAMIDLHDIELDEGNPQASLRIVRADDLPEGVPDGEV